MDLDLIGVTAASISAIRQCGPDRAVDRSRGIRAATQNAVGAGGGRRAQGDDERAIAIFVFVIFSSWRPRAPPFKRRRGLQKRVFPITNTPATSHRLDQERPIGEPDDQTL